MHQREDGRGGDRRGPLVSVIVPTCDRPTTLVPCLRSVLAQRADLEVLVVDDGRPGPDVPDVCAALADERIRVVPCTAGNAAGARNAGVAEARGAWLAFCDDDDLWAPDKLEAQLRALAERDAGWSCTGAIVVDGELGIIGHQRLTAETVRHLGEISVIPGGGSSVVVRADLVDAAGGFDETLTNGEDWDLWLRISDLADLIVVDRPLVAYRRWGASKSTDTARMTRSLETIAGRRAPGPPPSYVRERYIADQWFRARRRRRAGRAYLELARAHGRRSDRGRAVAAVVWPNAMARHDRRKSVANIPAAWRAEAEWWLAPHQRPALPPAATRRGTGASRATVVIVPRERFSVALRSLASVLAHTDDDVDIVYVDGGSPPAVRDALRREASRSGFRLIRTEGYLSPNQARNLGRLAVTTPYTVFVDNDVVVTPGWLDRLVDCAETTGAQVVGPMSFEGDPGDGLVHNAGGFWRFEEAAGRRVLVQDNRFGHRHQRELPAGLDRHRVDYVEFHCCLVRTSVFDEIGPLDERLLSTREHLDLCLAVAETGGEVWSETRAHVTYDDPPPVHRDDVAFFSVRWSEAWNRRSLQHFADKHGLDPSYLDRAARSNARRLALLHPITERTERWFGGRARRLVVAVLGRVEWVVNVVWVRRLERSSLARPRPAIGSGVAGAALDPVNASVWHARVGRPSAPPRPDFAIAGS